MRSYQAYFNNSSFNVTPSDLNPTNYNQYNRLNNRLPAGQNVNRVYANDCNCGPRRDGLRHDVQHMMRDRGINYQQNRIYRYAD